MGLARCAVVRARAQRHVAGGHGRARTRTRRGGHARVVRLLVKLRPVGASVVRVRLRPADARRDGDGARILDVAPTVAAPIVPRRVGPQGAALVVRGAQRRVVRQASLAVVRTEGRQVDPSVVACALARVAVAAADGGVAVPIARHDRIERAFPDCGPLRVGARLAHPAPRRATPHVRGRVRVPSRAIVLVVGGACRAVGRRGPRRQRSGGHADVQAPALVVVGLVSHLNL
mmetsp:Transcript_835/g.2614  ORF Transcript_835/g.2614 Transcript_835/m.2614 type:complete len:231 (+) Transcript_835:470-1162(+)